MQARLFGLRLLVLGIVGATVVVGCTGSRSTEQIAPLEGPSLSYSHMPTRDSLLPPGELSPGSGTVRPGHGPTLRARRRAASEASPYGCELTSRPHSKAAVRRNVYLYFPTAVVQAAGEQTMTVIFNLRLTLVDPTAPERSDTARTGTAEPSRGTGLQYARQHVAGPGVRRAYCVLPATPRARRLTHEQLVQWGVEEAAGHVLQTSGLGAKARPDLCPALVQARWSCTGCGSEACCSGAPWAIEYVLACDHERWREGMEGQGPWPAPSRVEDIEVGA